MIRLTATEGKLANRRRDGFHRLSLQTRKKTRPSATQRFDVEKQPGPARAPAHKQPGPNPCGPVGSGLGPSLLAPRRHRLSPSVARCATPGADHDGHLAPSGQRGPEPASVSAGRHACKSGVTEDPGGRQRVDWGRSSRCEPSMCSSVLSHKHARPSLAQAIVKSP